MHDRVVRAAPRRAFTLLELLVVIMIIGVLVTLMGGAAIDAYRGAERIRCANQLKQLATAVQGYYNRFGGDIPPAKYEHSDGRESYWVHYLIRTGCLGESAHGERENPEPTQMKTVLICPATEPIEVKEDSIIQYPDDVLAQGWYQLGDDENTVYCSYYWNGCTDRSDSNYWEFPSLLIKHSDTNKRSHVHNVGEIKKRTAMVMLADGVWYDGHDHPERIAARHARGRRRDYTHLAFYDSHVEGIERNPEDVETGEESDWDDDALVNRVGLRGGPPYFRLKDARATPVADEDENE